MSKRADIQTRLAEVCVSLGLDDAYGVLTGEHGAGRGSYRTVTFCKARSLDGEIRVYGPSFILIRTNRDRDGVRLKSADEAETYLRREFGR